MKKYNLILILIALITNIYSTQAQKNSTPDAVLFHYGNNTVMKNEFLRMYTKNINNQKPDYSEKALREYITLFARFKMKVTEAEKLQLDTLPNIQSELFSYRQQLAKTYLTDKEVMDKLVKEAYERKKKDVRVSHILISIPRGASDTEKVYHKVDSIYKAILNGADFTNIAKHVSEDRQSATNGGDIGYFSVLQVVYPFETAAYETPIGKLAKPFRTVYGYHILKKLDERPARGDIQVAQIMINVKESKGVEGAESAKKLADSLYFQLKKGANFEDFVEKFSDDKFSKNTKGVLQTISVGQMVTEFEDAAFNLKTIGEISSPVKTKFGYHIIKLIKKLPLKPYDSVKTDLEKRIEKDGRIDVAKQQYTEKLKAKLHYKDYPNALTELINQIPDSTLSNGSFRGTNYKKYSSKLFEMDGNIVFTQADFANYIDSYTKGRMYGGKESALRSLFKNYVDKVLNDYQENKLIDDNEEYRSLLTEYKDGIIIFDLTEKHVWNKATQDTTGMKTYFENNRNKYMWGPAIKADLYRSADETVAKAVVKILNKNINSPQDEVAKEVNGDGTQK
ncbi:MAG: PpiC-type peptidyl-prolyl cis-trans isomerase [Bacteroidetes bacterium OLB11]|nr:MAG: PpiC-type peptidyl-prolyl cis-trans isomerase [Bacteroidetes bacterium OLB11]